MNIDKHQAFIDSDEYFEFFEEYKLTIGLTIFCESLCKCTKVPTMESCVDMIISGGEESLRGMNYLLRDTALRKKFDDCDCEYHSRFKESQKDETDDMPYPLDRDARNSTNIYDFICKTCCEPVPDLDLICHSDFVPKFIPSKCAMKDDKKCEHCGIRKHYEDLEICPVWKSDEIKSRTFKCSKWEKTKIKESDKNSKEQWALMTHNMTALDILSLFEKELVSSREHYVHFKWSDHQRKLHQVMVDPDRAITIATDFGSIMDMTAACVDNQHIPQRMIRAIYFIYRAHTRLEYIDYDDEEKVKAFISVRCDVIHYLGKPVKSESIGKKPGGDSSEDKTGGKAQDTCFHVACLHDIITSVEKTRELKLDEDGKVLTFLYNIWTDGCGGQYKNRKCFYFTAAINDIFPGRFLRMAHYLAVKFRFKGPWDADGRVFIRHSQRKKHWRKIIGKRL